MTSRSANGDSGHAVKQRRGGLFTFLGALAALGLIPSLLWWSHFREPAWWLDGVSLTATVDPGLEALSDLAITLPIDPKEHVQRRGSFVVHGPDAIDITYGTGNGFTGEDTELRLRRSPDGSIACTCLATEYWDCGPPFSGALADVSGSVRVSSPLWSSGSSLIVAFNLKDRSAGEPNRHDAVLRIDIP